MATVAARFQVCPSDYIAGHDWEDLQLDYECATVLNSVDNDKKAAEYAALFGKK